MTFCVWASQIRQPQLINEDLHTKTEVLITGGGPVGMITALLLAKQNISSVVIERRFRHGGAPAAHQLNFRSNEILQRDAQVSRDLLRKGATPMNEYRWVKMATSLASPPLAKLDHVGNLNKTIESGITWAEYLNIPQDMTERAILQAVEAEPLVDLRFGHSFANHVEDESGVTTTVALDSGISRWGYHVRSRYIIDATGSKGVIRRRVNMTMSGERGVMNVINLHVRMDLTDVVPEAKDNFRDGGALMTWTFAPDVGGAVAIHHNMSSHSSVQIQHFPSIVSASEFTDNGARIIRSLIGRDDVPFEIEAVDTWRMDCQIADKYRGGSHGKTILVGDSAHRFPPTGGLGLNTGVADAHNLAWKMGMVIRGEASEDLLDSYGIERRHVAQSNSAVSLDNFHRMEHPVSVLGLDKKGAEMLAYLNYLLWPIPKGWRQGASHFIRKQVVSAATSAASADDANGERIRKQIQEAMDLQISHFNSIGLDLGFHYNFPDMGVVPDTCDESSEACEHPNKGWHLGKGIDGDAIKKQMPEWTYTYFPVTIPGSRLPHANLKNSPVNAVGANNERWKSSTHALLAYNRFTLITGEGGEAWIKAAKAIQDSGIKMKAFLINEEEEAWTKVRQVEANGCVVIRPDGHVAMRSMEMVADPAGFLETGLRHVLKLDHSTH
uniref:FAD-binding domain-containing protein n=1 Tax=Lotharella globosa TaxID=91324 RepID=A0A7S3YYY5_9EUKA|mmetsp:Transcript_21315/g.42751  ORF Transcript_21315/g.42751 Transcript_21315/m.42751 type:complete len:667 (+) Transcript_21315:529-2529(+)